jgi:hypothetical protein
MKNVQMSEEQKQAALREIEESRAWLVECINNKMDRLKEAVICGEELSDDGDAECVYPLTTMPELLKGSKPTAVIFGGERVPLKKWKAVYTEILKRCDSDAACHDKLMELRNKVSGRKRKVLSDDPGGMDKPVEIRDGLYAETYFDTGALLRMLTTGILNPVGYDYSGISVAVVWNYMG